MAKKEIEGASGLQNAGLSEKLKALQAATDKIEKSFGKGSIMKLGDESVENVDVIQPVPSALTPHLALAVIPAAE